MNKKRKIRMQRDCFAVKCCHLMGKDVKETSKLLDIDRTTVESLYRMFEMNLVDFDAEV